MKIARVAAVVLAALFLAGGVAFAAYTPLKASVSSAGVAKQIAPNIAIIEPAHGEFFGADAVAAKDLGMTLSDLRKAEFSGQTVAQLAQSKGVDLSKIEDDVMAAPKAALDVRVSQGVMMPDQEQKQLDAMRRALDQYFHRALWHCGPIMRPQKGTGSNTVRMCPWLDNTGQQPGNQASPDGGGM